MSTDTTTTTPTESVTGLAVDQMIETLTGFDEIAIESHFGGFSVYADGEKHPVRAMRALAFVHLRREGANDREAFQAAQNLTFNEVTSYFETPAEPDADLDGEDGPAGKA